MLLEIQEICKSFGDHTVLDKVSFSAQSGQATGLLGRNGAGKTTSIRILMNVFPANSGRILIDGKPIDYSKIRFGYLPEERGLYPKKKIGEQLVYFAELHGMEKAEAVSAVDRWLDRMDMSAYKFSRLDTLSKGNQQKIQLISAVAHDPDIVILDEPFSGLDPVNAQMLKDVVTSLVEEGKIVLFSSHQMSYVEEFCDTVHLLNAGHIVLSGDIRQIKASYPRDRLVIRAAQPEKVRAEYPGNWESFREDELILRLDRESDRIRVMQELTSRFDIDGIRVFEPSLNDIFVQYAKEQV
ncbi:MAG: ATP-binding cassette domain-containing protein [Clostridia bacterium]|nr:ATP-binding cassette domain-containing protein [Clostridia bacterium]